MKPCLQEFRAQRGDFLLHRSDVLIEACKSFRLCQAPCFEVDESTLNVGGAKGQRLNGLSQGGDVTDGPGHQVVAVTLEERGFGIFHASKETSHIAIDPLHRVFERRLDLAFGRQRINRRAKALEFLGHAGGRVLWIVPNFFSQLAVADRKLVGLVVQGF